MHKRMLFLFIATLALGISFVIISKPDKQIVQSRRVVRETSSKVNSNLAALPERFNRKALYFGASISKTGHFRVEGENVIQGYDLWQEHVNKEGGIKIGEQRYLVNIKYYDDSSELEKVKENITKLIVEDKVDFILGPFSSGYSNDPVMANFKNYGFAAMVPKPFDFEELSRVISEVLNR